MTQHTKDDLEYKNDKDDDEDELEEDDDEDEELDAELNRAKPTKLSDVVGFGDKTKHDSEPLEMVNHPKHYNAGRFEVIDVIRDWKLGFSLGNAVKYIARSEHKGNKVQDLQKAVWYIQNEIDHEKGE